MDQCLLPREASGGAARYNQEPRLRDDVWVGLSEDRFTQAELRYVYLSDVIIRAREIAAVVDRGYAAGTLRVGLALFAVAFLFGAVTLVVSNGLISVLTGAFLAAACLTSARAVEIYQRAGR
jgi:hypothetical protein